jgi:hypothetical protein
VIPRNIAIATFRETTKRATVDPMDLTPYLEAIRRGGEAATRRLSPEVAQFEAHLEAATQAGALSAASIGARAGIAEDAVDAWIDRLYAEITAGH